MKISARNETNSMLISIFAGLVFFNAVTW